MSVTSSGVFGFQATAALQVIGFPLVAFNWFNIASGIEDIGLEFRGLSLLTTLLSILVEVCKDLNHILKKRLRRQLWKQSLRSAKKMRQKHCLFWNVRNFPWKMEKSWHLAILPKNDLALFRIEHFTIHFVYKISVLNFGWFFGH